MTTNIVSLPSVDHCDSEDLTASLQKVLELYPNHAPAHHDLGGAYYQNGDNENALTHYEKAVEIDPDNVIYQKSLADFYYSVAGRVENALEIYFKVLDQQPQNLEVLQMVGHINVALQKFDDAEEYYKRVLAIDPGNQDAALLLDKLQNRLTSDSKPASAEEQYANIQTMINDGRQNDAVSAIETLLDSHPDFAQAHNDLGVLSYQQGDKDKALNCYEAAARLEPGNNTFQKNLADFYYVEQGRVEDAMQLYVNVLANDPEDAETLLILGHICVALHKFEDAETFYNRLLAVEPWNAEARENLEKLAMRHGPAAVAASPEEEYQKIQEQIQSGNGDAVKPLENLLAAHPQFALAHNDLGVLYYNQGDKENALNHYEQAARLEPHNLNFQKNLADFYFVESGRIEDALAIYNKVLEADFGDVEALMSVGLICEALERPEDARHFYNRVLENEPWNEDARDARQQLENLS
jgi:tetratricopeptide (TPR) repeat protein